MKESIPNLEPRPERSAGAEAEGRGVPDLGVVRDLMPPGVAVALAAGGGPTPDLFAEELAIVEGAVDSRRHEFAVGRSCARAALRELGMDPVPIPARDRAPVWPEGLVGSITHTRGLTIAVVGRRECVVALGVDVESRAEPMNERLDRFIRTAAERRNEPPGLAALDGLRVVFGAKECVHKCVAPISGVTLGFHEVEVDLGVADGRFGVRLTGAPRPGLPDLERLVGRYLVTPDWVITAAAIPVMTVGECSP